MFVLFKSQDVVLVKSGGPLGLSIIGGSDHSCVPFGTGEPGIFISKIIPGGAASRTGRLRMGDRLLAVNGQDIRVARHEDAVMALLATSDEMRLKIQHDPLPKGFQVRGDFKGIQIGFSKELLVWHYSASKHHYRNKIFFALPKCPS